MTSEAPSTVLCASGGFRHPRTLPITPSACPPIALTNPSYNSNDSPFYRSYTHRICEPALGKDVEWPQ
ncbi:hypothetical protein A0H81_12060 [Grifola frondosa]|uniref:Uncharacterized protein n=1 Tax=Grifola frondosa TaxID=5627 RepID=A0A1C7LYH9_GRIFR|nr:hypothetical protein A0H81_12060 [Grifola frondosa]